MNVKIEKNSLEELSDIHQDVYLPFLLLEEGVEGRDGVLPGRQVVEIQALRSQVVKETGRQRRKAPLSEASSDKNIVHSLVSTC